ncbi:MAG: lysophospholipid acyltransferase family protein [Planctomycetota bacterium]|nr:lysophospholipid acyltransferase family protein [Planctomycetota bacterium]
MHLPSSIWFLVLAVATISYCIVLWRRSEYSAWENCLYLPTFLMGRLLWRVHFTNEAPPELQTGGVLVANHRSSVDPFFVQLAARRRVHWLVAKEYCNHFLFGPILRACQVIPTNRSGVDTASTKQAIRITREGRLVGMFPEGRLNKTTAPLLSVRSGAAVVATQASVPIIPLLIEGSPYRRTVWSPVFMPAKVRITFGTPIPTGELFTDAEAATESANTGNETERQLAPSDAAIMKWGEQICALAGQPDFPVELASARSRRGRKQSRPQTFS